MTSTNADPGRLRRRLLIAAAVLLVLVVLVAIGLVLAARVAAQIWPPLDTPAVAIPAPPFEPDPDAPAVLNRALAKAEALERGALREALEPAGTPIGEARDVWRSQGELLSVVEDLLGRAGLQLPVRALDDPAPPRLLGALTIGELLLLRAWDEAAAGRAAATVADLDRALWFGLMLEHAGGDLLVAMTGLAVQRAAMTETVELLAASPTLTHAALAPLESRLRAASSWPSGLAAGFAAECLAGEQLWDELGQKSMSELFETSSFDPPDRSARREEEEAGGGGTWVFDVDKTRAWARADCARRVEALSAPRSARRPLAPVTLWHGGFNPGEWVDNPVGRIMLEIARPSFARHYERGDTVIARRRLLLLRLVLARFAGEHEGAAPATLADLVPDYLSKIPQDPWTDAALKYDATARRLWSAGAEAAADDEAAADLSITF